MDVGHKRKRAVKNDSVIRGGWVLGLNDEASVHESWATRRGAGSEGARRFRLRSPFNISVVRLNRQLDTRIWNSEDGPAKECY